ncbi:MAG: diguanylate cyclase [Rhodobacteraceae bacterium]|nr:MAG: diguanylate cyclase [Paracoccaceae bacterium]
MSLGRIVLRAKLSAACYDSLLAVSGAAALKLARTFQPDLVLMDCSLPDMAGPDVCRALRADPQTAHIPIVLFSSDTGRETRLEALAAGADDVLRKPLDESYLLSRLRALLRKSSTERDYQSQGKTSLSLDLAHRKATTGPGARIALVCHDTASRGLAHDLSDRLYDQVVSLPEMLNPTRPEALPDVLLLSPDVIELHGLAIISELRSRELTRDLPIVALMPAPLRPLRGMALDLGAEEVLQEPFDDLETQLRLSSVVKRKLWADAMREALSAELDLATRDPLTALFNRRHGMLHLGRMMIPDDRQDRTPFALLLIDIDNFKRINDTFGHLAGDRVLIEVARRLNSVIRANDMLARYGGEEFLLTLPGLSASAARKMAERIRKSIESESFSVKGVPGALRVTVSIGVANHDPVARVSRKDHTLDMEALIDEADRALHQAKETGRNRVSMAVTPKVAQAACCLSHDHASAAVSARLPARQHRPAAPRATVY